MQQYQGFDQYGGNQNNSSKLHSKPPNLNTQEIKVIVDGLNRPPFMCHLSMVEFDDKAPLELLELINRVFVHLDKQHEAVDMQKETQEKTEERICGFLKVLGYPCDFNPNYCRDIVHGEKKACHHILYWLVSRLPDLTRKAYTAKFLVPLQIPDEYMVDEEMRGTLQRYKDLQAEFQAVHQNTEALRNESMNPAELKKEITQLEQEKEQLLTKINLFKNRGDSADFQALLEATSKLRKEQENDARLNEKERELSQMIEMSEHQLLSVRQRLMDVQKINRDNLAPEQMLNNLRNETRQNREINNDIIGRELQDKQERLQRIELILQEPQTTQAELERLTADTKRLQRDCQVLETKIKPEAGEDKLSIYRSQANAVAKKKEQKQEEMKKLEMEKIALEKTMQEKEENYAKTKGQKYMKRDDFRQYAANLREKNTQYKQHMKSLDEIKAECTVLQRTKEILKSRAGNVDEFLKELEMNKGVAGYTSVEDQIVGVSELKEQLDNNKSQSFEELMALVKQNLSDVKEKKTKLAQGIKKMPDSIMGYLEKESGLVMSCE